MIYGRAIRQGGAGKVPPPAEVTNIKAEGGNAQIKFTWTDPEDIIAEGVNVNEWKGTVIVLNEEHLPVDQNDGRRVYDSKVKNQHQTEPYIAEGLTNDKVYYYGIFPYSKYGAFNIEQMQTGEVTPRALPPVKPLNQYTWAEIEQIANMGNKSADGNHWEINGQIYLTLGDETALQNFGTEGMIPFQIADFLHDELETGGKASITFIAKKCLNTDRPMDSENNVGGYRDCDLRQQINSEIFNLAPTDLSSRIKSVKKVSSKGYINSPNPQYITTMEKFWLLGAVEINGKNYPGEGTKYPIFTSTASAKRDKDYFTRTAVSSNVRDYWVYSYNLEAVDVTAFENPKGVLLAFCVGNGGV